MSWVALVSSLLAAISNAYAALLARVLKPDSSSNVRRIVQALEATLFALRVPLGAVTDEVDRNGCLPRLDDRWSASAWDKLRALRASVDELHDKVSQPSFCVDDPDVMNAARARLWIVLGGVFATVAVAAQIAASAA